MFYRLLADLVVIVHFAFLVFIATGGLLAWRWPRLVWLHMPAVAWGAAIITIGFTCPLTPLEKHFQRLAGERGYAGGFVDHYIENVIYPERLTPLLRTLAAAAVVVGYAGLLDKRRRASACNTPGDAAAGTRADSAVGGLEPCSGGRRGSGRVLSCRLLSRHPRSQDCLPAAGREIGSERDSGHER